jgi:hypothetical protein
MAKRRKRAISKLPCESRSRMRRSRINQQLSDTGCSFAVLDDSVAREDWGRTGSFGLRKAVKNFFDEVKNYPDRIKANNSTEKGIDQADTAGRLRLIAFLNELLVRSKNVFVWRTPNSRFWEKGTQQ